MPFANLNSASPAINIAEDTRTADTITTISVASTSAIALPANTNRASYSIYNAGTVNVLFKEGITVTNGTHKFVIPPGFMWTPDGSEPRYLGAISLMTTSGTASVQIAESILI